MSMNREVSVVSMYDFCSLFAVLFILFAFFFFFFNDTATTEIYTLSLHDALPISWSAAPGSCPPHSRRGPGRSPRAAARSEEHTSELQSQSNLVCRLLLEKKKKIKSKITTLQLSQQV